MNFRQKITLTTRFKLTAIFVFCHTLTVLYADTFYVSQGEDIQTVIDGAGNGDTVLLFPGTHVLTSRLSLTTGIKIGSVAGSANTVVDGNDTTPCLYVNHADAIVDGLTITRGKVTDQPGAGVYCLLGTVNNCVITSNAVDHTGDNYNGGGIYCGNQSIVSNCTISCNSAAYGGGAYCASGGFVTDCRIISNTATEDGGGGYCRGVISDCFVASNTAHDTGGGIMCGYQGSLRTCRVFDNAATNDAGGVHCAYAVVENCLISGNHAGAKGGGLQIGADGHANNCTVCDNYANTSGGGIAGYDRTSYVKNCIIYFNQAGINDNIAIGSYSYTCTWPRPAGSGNIAEDPLFTDRANRDYNLLAVSPCIDIGINISGLISDLGKKPRPLDGNADGINAFDMGAYEYIHAQADSDSDKITDLWEFENNLNLISNDADDDNDNDKFSNYQEYIADTDPVNAKAFFGIAGQANNPSPTLYFSSSSNRIYWLLYCNDLLSGSWSAVTGQTDILGTGGMLSLSDTNAPSSQRFYKIQVNIP